MIGSEKVAEIRRAITKHEQERGQISQKDRLRIAVDRLDRFTVPQLREICGTGKTVTYDEIEHLQTESEIEAVEKEDRDGVGQRATVYRTV